MQVTYLPFVAKACCLLAMLFSFFNYFLIAAWGEQNSPSDPNQNFNLQRHSDGFQANTKHKSSEEPTPLGKDDTVIHQIRTQIKAKNYKSGAQLCSAAISSKLDLAYAHYLRAYCNYKLGYEEQTQKDLHSSKAIDADVILKKARAFQKSSDAENAIREYSQALELEPKNLSYLVGRTVLLQQSGKMQEALADCNALVKAHPNNFLAYFVRGQFYESQKRLDLALQDFSKAIELNENTHPPLSEMRTENAFPYLTRGQIYLVLQNFPKALADANKAIELEPNNPQCHLVSARTLARMARNSEAVKSYSKAIDLSGQPNAGYFLERGYCQSQLHNFKAAIEDCTKAIQLDKSNKKAYLARADLYRTSGQLSNALSDYIQAEEKGRNNVLFYINRSELYRKLEMHAEAINELTKVLAMNGVGSHNSGFLILRAEEHFKMGHYVNALEDFFKAGILSPSIFLMFLVPPVAVGWIVFVVIRHYNRRHTYLDVTEAEGHPTKKGIQEVVADLISRVLGA